MKGGRKGGSEGAGGLHARYVSAGAAAFDGKKRGGTTSLFVISFTLRESTRMCSFFTPMQRGHVAKRMKKGMVYIHMWKESDPGRRAPCRLPERGL